VKKTLTIFSLLAFAVYWLSCEHDPYLSLDKQLEEDLNLFSKGGSYEWYIMPESHDYAALPNQDAKNPVTEVKVALGRMLFYETGLALEPTYPFSKGTYSCSSCHVPSRGFTAGRFQGVADGAVGFGVSGEGRSKHPVYLGDDVDAQGARPLPTMNLTYVTNALWALLT
jgi:cytochrome c peroxidase